MTNDNISRQAAIEALADYIHNVDRVIGTGHLSADDCKDAAISVLADLPSAGHTGHWVLVNRGLDIYMCDQCGEILQIDRVPIWDYCPVCGARM